MKLHLENSELLESEFLPHEMFISKTNKKGIIINGNNVFVRVSEYSNEEIYDSPHNIIRHPDMPKSIFKLLWDKIKKNEMIAAYVKNKSKTGKYYWVLAFVFSTDDGYFSIRIKPLSSIRKNVEEIYKKMLNIELSENVEAATKFLMSSLLDLGFKSYEQFMLHFLSEEFKKRDKSYLNKLDNITNSGTLGQLQELRKLSGEAASSFVQSNTDLLKFGNVDILSDTQFKSVTNVFSRLEYLSFNMSISANRLGNLGGTLSIISNNFQTSSKLVFDQFEKFKNQIDIVKDNLQEVLVSSCCSQLQTEMLCFYFGELIHDYKSLNIDSNNFLRKKSSELNDLLSATKLLVLQSCKKQKKFVEDILNLKKDTKLLLNYIIRLDLIKTGGKLESSRSAEILNSFQPFVLEMDQFIVSVQNPIEDVLFEVSELIKTFEAIEMSATLAEHTINQVDLIIRENFLIEHSNDKIIAV